jgi:catechol 2,3-dioxygenase-like lactoylglutathione lyase family enzyme
MESKGWSHVGLATRDIERTRRFYEGVLGFRAVRYDIIKVKEGGEIHHAFFDTGRSQLLAFMEFRAVPGGPALLDTDLNRVFRIPKATHAFHIALEAGNEAELVATRAELVSKGVAVTPVVDFEWAKSIFFRDPNDIVIEYCFLTREFTDDDAIMRVRFEFGLDDPVPWTDFRTG